MCRELGIINPRHACAARVTVVGSVCPSVCVCVSVNISPLEHLCPENHIMYSLGNEGQKICGFSLKLLRCGDPAILPSYGVPYGGHYSSACANKRGVSTCVRARVLRQRATSLAEPRLLCAAKRQCGGNYAMAKCTQSTGKQKIIYSHGHVHMQLHRGFAL